MTDSRTQSAAVPCPACRANEWGWCPDHPPFKVGPVARMFMPERVATETDVLSTCCTALDSLPPEAARRVLDYLNARYPNGPEGKQAADLHPSLPPAPGRYQWRHNDDLRRWELGWEDEGLCGVRDWMLAFYVTDEYLRDALDAAHEVRRCVRQLADDGEPWTRSLPHGAALKAEPAE